jgi:ectoine hydroxylase-related dioxygenase (phytanoyl-CoA dioxygenase family)
LTAGGQPIRLKYDPLAPAAYKYVISEQEGFRIPAFQRIVGDQIFVNVAQAYLRATPAMLSAAVWWSAVKGGQASSEAAQLFHFDYDPAPIWLKFFVYLTDVDAGAGPHVFVRGSHQRRDPRAKEILKRGYVRLEDKEVASVYGHENIIEVTGRRGTVLVADTLGFHKGKAPQTSARCLAQLVFATPIFVPTRAAQLTIPAGADPSLLKTFSEYPWAFKRFRIAT